ncbi:MAG TPA: SET domain-containing protein [Tepidisphaeraceae bacterium]|nr:SET domain-containing protein [Tepidisphaeraceae bacterium]
MFVETEVRETGVYGKALYAAAPIKRGNIVCSFTLGSDVTTEDEYVRAVSENRQPITRTGTRYAGKYFTFGNVDAPYNYVNHSFKPNLLCHCGVVMALRDVARGEELTLDYRTLIDTTDAGIYNDAVTGREIRGYPARETMLRTARELVALLESLEDWEG